MWHKVAKLSDITPEKPQIAEVEGKQIALFNVDGTIYAIDGVCPHRGGPLGEGYLDGSEVTCPWHAWTFDVKSGVCQTVPGVTQKTFKVKIENEEVFIDTGSA